MWYVPIFNTSTSIPVLTTNIDKLYYCKKHYIATITQLRSIRLLTAKTPLLHMLYYMKWLTHGFGTRTGGWELDRSHVAGTSYPSHWQQVEEQAPKPVGWMMCFLRMDDLCSRPEALCNYVYIYINIYICTFYMSYVSFGLPIVPCSLVIIW